MIGHDVDGGEMFEDHPELEAFAADLRQAAASAPAPRVGAALAAVLDGSMAPAPADITVPVGRRRRRRLDTRARLRLVLAGGVAAVVLLITAASGGLPDPAQRNVARFADHLGVDLPDGDGGEGTGHSDEDRPTPPTSTPPTAPPAGRSTTPSTSSNAVVPESVADADAVEDLRDGDDDPSTPGRAEEAPGQDNRPSDVPDRDDEKREELQPDRPTSTTVDRGDPDSAVTRRTPTTLTPSSAARRGA
jgi:hypothetical protein